MIANSLLSSQTCAAGRDRLGRGHRLGHPCRAGSGTPGFVGGDADSRSVTRQQQPAGSRNGICRTSRCRSPSSWLAVRPSWRQRFEGDARDAIASAQQRVIRIADRITDQALRGEFLSRSLFEASSRLPSRSV